MQGMRRNCLILLSILLWAVTAGAVEVPLPAPDFSLKDIAGQDSHLRTMRGRPLLLVFGNTFCPHCEQALSILENISQSLTDDEMKVIFIAIEQSKEDIENFFAGSEHSYDILLDETGNVSRRYGINKIPTCVFIDDYGLIQYLGSLDEDTVWLLLAGEQPKRRGGFDLYRPVAEPNEKTKRFIVELDEEPSLAKTLPEQARKSRRKEMTEAAKNIGARIVYNYGDWKNRIVVEIPSTDTEKLKQFPGFKTSKEDRRVHALLEDSAYQIRADYAWDNAITGQGINVCVIDTGIDYTHPDLMNAVVAQHNFVNGSDDAMDDYGHGTHVAGIIASQGLQYRGISYDVGIMSAKVLDADGFGDASDVIMGINWCVQQDADIISLSLGEGLFSGTCDYDDMAIAVNEAFDSGVVVVCAAGNDGDLTAMVSPACASKAIAVGALDKLDNIASYSDGGAELDVVAPGGDMFGGTTYPEIVSAFSTEVAYNPAYCLYFIGYMCFDNYFVVDGLRYIRAVGTSMAAPHVAAAAALMLEENPSLTPAQVKTLLEENTDDLGPPGWDNIYGWGKINIEKALDNIPPEASELTVEINEPNITDFFAVAEQFLLAVDINCFGGDGCGQVNVHAQFCTGRDCNDFTDINNVTTLSTDDENPVELGALSGYSIETVAPIIFDAQTTLDISEHTFVKSVDPAESAIGSTLPSEYNTGDLEPEDGLGAIGEDAQQIYEFEMPAGNVSRISVRMEHYMVIQWVDPPSGWRVFTSNVGGAPLHLIGDCIPPSGGGGEPPSPDCWFVSEAPQVLADLNPGGTNYIKLISHDVGDDGFGLDWLTFNNIEAIIEYQIDPNNDLVYEYFVKLDISDVNATDQVTAARLNINVAQAAEGAVGEVYQVDNSLTAAATAQQLHDAPDPCYSNLSNPIKTFSRDTAGIVSLNVKAAVEEALSTNQDTIAFQIREQNNDQLFAIDANAGPTGPELTISQRIHVSTQRIAADSQTASENITKAKDGFTLKTIEKNLNVLTKPQDDSSLKANQAEPITSLQASAASEGGPYLPAYDTIAVKDVSEDTYAKHDNPNSALIGSPFVSEYNTGDLEPDDALGAIGENAYSVYQYQIPPGTVKKINVRMEHYLVLQWEDPHSGWRVFTADTNGQAKHLIGECIPISGGGGEPEPPDCWFVSDDPAVLADINSGGDNYIRLVSFGVGEFDWLTFNDIEVIVEYEVDPNNDNVRRYYLKYDISELAPDAQVNSATLNLYVAEPTPDAVAEISLVNSSYDPCTGAYTIYNAEDADYSSMTNPIKSFACDTVGLKQMNVRAAFEDAVESGLGHIAFLITEREENALFTLDTNENPPNLDFYLKSDISSASARWNVLPEDNGYFTLRALATNNIGLTAVSDTIVINVHDQNLPVINSVDCLVNSTWGDCRLIRYGDNLQKIRIDANDPQQIPQVHLKLRNIPDNKNFINAPVTYDGGYFIYDVNRVISDSGEWQIQVVALDANDNNDIQTITWNIPWGQLETRILSPAADINVPKSGSFDVTAGVRCLGAECPNVEISLRLNEPVELEYDNATAEDYGDIGSTEAYLAVRFVPGLYPVQLKTARFYVWDTTTYPFELHVWNGNGPGGKPGTELITPITVDPVVSSAPPEVAWFDIDLSDQDIIIESGSFYIGWRQLEGTKNNQVGFDTDGPLFNRTWAYLPSLGWFNLDEYCQRCGTLPQFCEFCGNLMIRAVMGVPDTYEGILPTAMGAAPFYTLDENPKPCQNDDLDAGQICEATFTLHAVGPAATTTRLYSRSANNFSAAVSGATQITITPPQNPCDAVNLDAISPVNSADLAVLTQEWLQTSPPLFADINNDQIVNIRDFALIADFWLQNCD